MISTQLHVDQATIAAKGLTPTVLSTCLLLPVVPGIAAAGSAGR